jgi:hypothetical protein
MKNTTKSWQWYVPFMSLYLILSQWRCPVASSKALDFLHQAMHMVTYRHIAIAIKTASKAGVFSSLFVCLLPWQLLEQYRASSCPMAVSSGFWYSSGHDALGDCFVLHRHTTMAIKMASGGGGLFPIIDFLS